MLFKYSLIFTIFVYFKYPIFKGFVDIKRCCYNLYICLNMVRLYMYYRKEIIKIKKSRRVIIYVVSSMPIYLLSFASDNLEFVF